MEFGFFIILDKDNYSNKLVNFKDFFYSLLVLFKITTGDDWGLMANDLAKYNRFCSNE